MYDLLSHERIVTYYSLLELIVFFLMVRKESKFTFMWWI